MITGDYILVEKEAVADLHFPKEDVLTDSAQKLLRDEGINRANSLGNLEHYKVKIYFADNTGSKWVNTTIWGVTDEAILLKQNVVLPIHRIIKLEI